MAIPKYDDMYHTFLECLVDMQPHRISEIRDVLASKHGVSDAERQMLLSSGRLVFDNRVGWTGTYLKKAGLVDRPVRSTFQLTALGQKTLSENPKKIDNKYLEQFDSFRQFFGGDNSSTSTPSLPLDTSGQSPQDTLDSAYKQITDTLADDVLAEVMKQTPAFFENLVVRLLEKMGYGGSMDYPGIVVGKSGDEGIDGIIKEDKLGFNHIYIQAKRWDRDTTVGRPEIQKFVGALAGQGADKGLFITTAQFTKEAREYVKKQHTTKVVLVDGPALANYMIENNIGVSTEAVYEIKRIDTDYFSDDT